MGESEPVHVYVPRESYEVQNWWLLRVGKDCKDPDADILEDAPAK